MWDISDDLPASCTADEEVDAKGWVIPPVEEVAVLTVGSSERNADIVVWDISGSASRGQRGTDDVGADKQSDITEYHFNLTFALSPVRGSRFRAYGKSGW